MSTEFINLSEIYLPTAGGTIDGDIEVGGAITVNDGSGAGTNYDVAYEISQLRAENEELKAAWDSVSQNKILWSGAAIMGEGQSITFSEYVSNQIHGIVLVFSEYNTSASTHRNQGFWCRFVPKYVVYAHDGAFHQFSEPTWSGGDTIWLKGLWLYDTKISGHACSAYSSDPYRSSDCCLRYVIGV